jgi:desampylase
MSVKISRAVHAALLAEAAARPMVEICGLLLGDDRVERYVDTENVAVNPKHSFEIDPKALFNMIKIERAGGERLIGYYHSHPNGRAEPSERDRQQAQGDTRLWVIVANGTVTAWRMTETGFFDAVALIIID